MEGGNGNVIRAPDHKTKGNCFLQGYVLANRSLFLYTYPPDERTTRGMTRNLTIAVGDIVSGLEPKELVEVHRYDGPPRTTEQMAAQVISPARPGIISARERPPIAPSWNPN